ncbi:MAG TPA: carboxypeptidase regulatory-like domain-containing protein [Candidatus Sulfotelmatobacter sp.]|nr:carboxypeptidase regulatory-like domain-containing protein [Candidatus Sulfotelmatobacter sp.]
MYSANAQSTATLQGTVSDPAGATVPNAKVVASNEATGVKSETVSDSAGAYLFPSLLIGNYKLEITASGFQKVVLNGLKLDVASTVTQNIALTLGQSSQTVEVIAEEPLINTSSNEIGQVINDKTVQQIPLNGRHFTDLSLLTPGTVTPPANGFLSAPLRGQGSFGINTAGQREDTTNWLVNGVNLNDNVQNQITFQPPIDTLAEYKIDNSSFPAQYGRNSGAIVNLATRSGTNEYHGELFEFFRNNDLDARNFFNAAKDSKGNFLLQAPFKRNDFGVDAGGPILKNKLFFFLAYEGLRQHQSLSVSTPVPSVNDRATVTSPAINSLLKLIPAANLVGTGTATDPNTFNLFSGGVLANVSLNQGSADIDYELSQKDSFHWYYVVQKDLRQEPTAGGAIAANLPGFGDTRDGLRHLLTFSEDHVFSPTLSNTVRLGFNRIHLTFTPNGLLDPSAFNITLPPGSPVASGLPFINVAGTIGFGGPTFEPQGRGDTTFVLNDGVSWLRGRHTFMFGGEIRRAYNNNIAFNIGSLTYSTQANFLADKANAFTVQLGSGNDKILQPAYDVFAQDSFKFKSNLTLNFGLRYAWNATPSEARGRFTNFDPLTGNLVLAGQPYQQNNVNFQPRVGFAWDPFKNGKTSVRGGYAIMTQAPTTNIVSPLSSNPPFAVPISASSATNAITAENPSAAVVGTSLGPTAINPGFNNSYAQDWNLSVQRQLTASLGLEIAYVGVKGTHLQLTQNINQPFVTNDFYGSTRPFPALPATSPIIPAQCAAPNPNCPYGTINQINSGGNSNYNAVWATLNKHVSRGLQFLATYTYSKSLDYNSLSTGETYIIQNAYNPRGDYGDSEFDVRNRVALSGFYQLPFKGNRLESGWQFGIVFQAQSGNPVNPTLAIGPGAGISLTVRPDLLAPIGTSGNPSKYFTNAILCEPFNGTPSGGAPAIPACAATPFATLAVPCTFSSTPTTPGGKTYPIVPGTCHPGTLGRNAIPGPAFVNTDFSVTKDTKITERLNLQFRTEMFDVFNHPNFGNPVLTATSGSFGIITSTRFPTGDFGSSRQVQFALLLQF